MKRSDFLAIIPGLLIASKVKTDPVTDIEWVKSNPILLERVTFTNLKERQQDYLFWLRKGMMTQNEAREIFL